MPCRSYTRARVLDRQCQEVFPLIEVTCCVGHASKRRGRCKMTRKVPLIGNRLARWRTFTQADRSYVAPHCSKLASFGQRSGLTIQKRSTICARTGKRERRYVAYMQRGRIASDVADHHDVG